jgi:hypothetical protein
MRANRQRDNDPARHDGQDKWVAKRRRNAVDLVGAAVGAAGNDPGAFDEARVGDVKLVREERSGRDP